MKSILSIISVCLFVLQLHGQKEFHVFPKDHQIIKGSEKGDGSLQNPWDLQTALGQKPDVVNGGDTIWLHGGVYTGRFNSQLYSTINGKNIIVSSYEDEWAILNGNVNSKEKAVLSINSKGVTFKNFEVTFLGEFSRDVRDISFSSSNGINHYVGDNCKFLNLRIHNNPGSGFGSWKETNNALIENCLIFNNGFMSEKRGSGVGLYVQNQSSQNRIIRRNIIFNNYYKGVEIWSASSKSKYDYVKNVILEDNIFFNNGLIAGVLRDNLIIATDNEEGPNIAKNIVVRNNVFYHNVSLSKTIENTEGSSLTLGFNKSAPVKDIIVEDNIIIGRKDAIRFLSVESIKFKNNLVYGEYVRFSKNNLSLINSHNYDFDNNTYFTSKPASIRIESERDYNLMDWYKKYKIDKNSTSNPLDKFRLSDSIKVTKNNYKPNSYRVVLFSKEGSSVNVDFSEYSIPANTKYIIKDVENLDSLLKSGVLNDSALIEIPMNLEREDYKTLNNFGVFIVDFEVPKTIEKSEQESFFKRFFNWLF